ncbi:unnamed protein product [Clavelina lepadiformis]|uniref:Uncharacterized protein n=1 Tax=Clavelina lepadiformis TaxID=159417 RepID=A0ABP0EXN3_CLALP
MRRLHQPRVVPRPQIPRPRTIVVDGDTIPEDIPEDYRDIYQSNWRAIRTHFHIGNTVQERYTFRIPDQSMIDQGPETICDRTEFDQFLIDIQRKNIRQWSDRLKSESAWVVESICNVEFYINPLRYIPIDIPEALPEFIISNVFD